MYDTMRLDKYPLTVYALDEIVGAKIPQVT